MCVCVCVCVCVYEPQFTSQMWHKDNIKQN